MKNIDEKDFESQNNVLETITAFVLIFGVLFVSVVIVASYLFEGI